MADDPQASMEWLWSEIERHYGAEAAELLRNAFNAQSSTMPPIDEQTIMACPTTNSDQAEMLAARLQAAGYSITAAQVVALGTVHNVCFYLFGGSEEHLEVVYQICCQVLELLSVLTKYQRFITAQATLEQAGYSVMRWHGWFVVRQAGRWVAALDTIEQLEAFAREHRIDESRTSRGFLKSPPEA